MHPQPSSAWPGSECQLRSACVVLAGLAVRSHWVDGSGVLEEVDDEEFEHPVVDALVNKQEALEAYQSGESVMQEVLTGRADGI